MNRIAPLPLRASQLMVPGWYASQHSIFCFISISCLLLINIQAFAQRPDTAFASASIRQLAKKEIQRTKTEWPINTGGQSVEYASIEGEHPYFIPTWKPGIVRYLNQPYNVSVLLDLRGDKLIIQHPLYDVKIELSQEKVSEFSFDVYRFININRDSIKNLPESGYYQLLQTGHAKLVARRQKTIQRSIASQKAVAIVKETNRYYVIKDGIALPVKSRKSLLNALSDWPELKQELKKNRVRFGSKKEAGLSAAVGIYNQHVKSGGE